MKKTLLLLIIVLATTNLHAQWSDQEKPQEPEVDLTHEVNIDLGVYMTSTIPNHTLIGQSYSVQTARFITDRTGFRSGLTLVKMQEASRVQIMVPLYFCIRTLKPKPRQPIDGFDSFTNLFGQILVQLLMPQAAELDMGANIGYGIAKINNSTIYSYAKKCDVKYGYQFESNFIATTDFGVRLKYKIYRFGIIIAPMASYMITQNYIFKSEIETDSFNNKRASWFFRGTVGVSYNF